MAWEKIKTLGTEAQIITCVSRGFDASYERRKEFAVQPRLRFYATSNL